MAKRPYLQFYPGDWLRDNVAGCSLAAQGLWLRMLLIAHDSERYGYLQQNRKPIPPDAIARRCGTYLEPYLVLLRELDDAGIPSRTERGIIFSRRMVKDAKDRESTAERVANFRKTNKVCNGDVTPKYASEDDIGLDSVVVVDSKILKEKEAAEIYERYPRKIGRKNAVKAITSAGSRLLQGKESSAGLFETVDDVRVYLLHRVGLYAKSPDGNAGTFTPHPATWFNQSRYLDDEKEWWKRGEPEPSTAKKREQSNRSVITESLRRHFGEDAGSGDGHEREGNLELGDGLLDRNVVEGKTRSN